MRQFILASVLSLLAQSAFASDFVVQSIQNSTVQTVAIIVADILEATSLATSHETTNAHRKEEARKIQNDIQSYSLSGELSLYLAEKVKLVKDVDSRFSEAEALDVLILATEKILATR